MALFLIFKTGYIRMFNLKKYGTLFVMGIARLGAFFANSSARKKNCTQNMSGMLCQNVCSVHMHPLEFYIPSLP
jgi:hypothetical protein